MTTKKIRELTLGELSAVCKRRDAVCGETGNTCFGCPLHAACEHSPSQLALDLEVDVPEEIGVTYSVDLSLTAEDYVDEKELKELLTSILENGLKDRSIKLTPDSFIRIHREGVLCR